MTTQPPLTEIDSDHFRRVMGRYPTGVAVIGAMDRSGRPAGLTVGSFSSVSLAPPLVAFMPAKSSTTWPRIRDAGKFCVSVLSHDQELVCRALARSGPDKFDRLDYTLSSSGSPYLTDASIMVDCTTDSIIDAGDHEIVLGRVRQLENIRQGLPLLFFEGSYGSFTPFP